MTWRSASGRGRGGGRGAGRRPRCRGASDRLRAMEVRSPDDADEPGPQVALLAADRPGRGAGGALLRALEELAHRRGGGRLLLAAANGGTPALRFYQCRGWDPVALHTGAVGRAQLLTLGILRQGVDGIPVRHLLELGGTVGSGRGMP